MGHRRGSARQRFSAAKADRKIGDPEIVEEGESLFLASFHVEREGRASTGAMAFKNVRLPRPLLEEAEIIDLFDLRMVAQEFTNLLGILSGALHSKLQRLE